MAEDREVHTCSFSASVWTPAPSIHCSPSHSLSHTDTQTHTHAVIDGIIPVWSPSCRFLLLITADSSQRGEWFHRRVTSLNSSPRCHEIALKDNVEAVTLVHVPAQQ